VLYLLVAAVKGRAPGGAASVRALEPYGRKDNGRAWTGLPELPGVNPTDLWRRSFAAKATAVPANGVFPDTFRGDFSTPQGIPGVLELFCRDLSHVRWQVTMMRDGLRRTSWHDTGPATRAYITVPPSGATVRSLPGESLNVSVRPSGEIALNATAAPLMGAMWHPWVSEVARSHENTVQWTFDDAAAVPVPSKSSGGLAPNSTTLVGYPPRASLSTHGSRGFSIQMVSPGGTVLHTTPVTTGHNIDRFPPQCGVQIVVPAAGANLEASFTWRDAT
jgi:hypothetical protein